MAHTRILLVDMPQLLREIVRETLSAERDLEIVGELAGPEELPEAARSTGCDVVVAGGEGAGWSSAYGRLLEELPRAKVLVLAPDGRRAALYELRPHRVRLGEVSPGRLVEVIRSGRAEKGAFPCP